MSITLVGGYQMTKKRQRGKKPFDPAEAARIEYERRRKPERWGANDEALALASNADVIQEAETRNRVRRITRFDCFALLHARDGLANAQLTAIRRLQEDIAIRYGVDGSGSASVQVDCGGSAELVTVRSIDAGERIEDALLIVGAQPAKLLIALSEPQVIRGEQINWRATVERITGELNQHAQAACVRQACEGLRMAYQEVDKRPRKAA